MINVPCHHKAFQAPVQRFYTDDIMGFIYRELFEQLLCIHGFQLCLA